MKLSRSNSRKLTQVIWLARFRKTGIVGAIAVALIAGAATFNYYRITRADPTLDVQPVNAIVYGQSVTRAARRGFVFHARLADGREVDAIAPNGFAPPDGTPVILDEAKHQSGRLTYELVKRVE